MIIQTVLYLFIASTTTAGADEHVGQFVSLVPPKAAEILESGKKTQTWTLRVFSQDDMEYATGDKITIVAKPGTGLSATYTKKSGDAKNFNPDEVDPGGAGDPIFSFTATKVKADWIQLPERPFSKPVWINPKADWKIAKTSAMIEEVPNGQVLKFGTKGNIVITAVKNRKVTYRDEIPADTVECNGEDDSHAAADKAAAKTKTAPAENFFDSDGHLLVTLAYLRGC
jgi:hypothetical protein